MTPPTAGGRSTDNDAATVPVPHPTRAFGFSPAGWLAIAAVAGPVAMALLLVSWRHQLDTGDDALFFVVVIVAVASSGRRLAAAIAALVSALAFDFFLTLPYYSFRITNRDDLIQRMSGMKELRELSLTGSVITNEQIRLLVQTVPRLEVLDLTDVVEVSLNSDVFVSQLLELNQCLKVIFTRSVLVPRS